MRKRARPNAWHASGTKHTRRPRRMAESDRADGLREFVEACPRRLGWSDAGLSRSHRRLEEPPPRVATCRRSRGAMAPGGDADAGSVCRCRCRTCAQPDRAGRRGGTSSARIRSAVGGRHAPPTGVPGQLHLCGGGRAGGRGRRQATAPVGVAARQHPGACGPAGGGSRQRPDAAPRRAGRRHAGRSRLLFGGLRQRRPATTARAAWIGTGIGIGLVVAAALAERRQECHCQ